MNPGITLAAPYSPLALTTITPTWPFSVGVKLSRGRATTASAVSALIGHVTDAREFISAPIETGMAGVM